MLKHEAMMLAGAVVLAVFFMGLAMSANRTSYDRRSECECECDASKADDSGGLHYGLNLSPSGKLQFGLQF